MYHTDRKLMGSLSALLLALTLWGCGAEEGGGDRGAVLTEDGLYFDTAISVTVAADSEGRGGGGPGRLHGAVPGNGNHIQPDDPDSELYRVNHRNRIPWKFRKSWRRSSASDWSSMRYPEENWISPSRRSWSSGISGEERRCCRIRKNSGERWSGWTVHPCISPGGTLTFDREDTELDLGALGKGLRGRPSESVSGGAGHCERPDQSGAETCTRWGERPDGGPWRVGIQKPFADRGETDRVIEVSGLSVVSSGIYERYFELDGVIYHHVLDPDTGYPVQNTLTQATVVCGESLLGDALSTTCLLLGEEQAAEVLEKYPDVEVYFETA